MKEVKVETYLKERVESCGGTCEKHVSPGQKAVPDRLITWPSGVLELVETKAPLKGPRSDQARDHAARARRRAPVTVINSKEGVDAFIHARRDHWRGYELL